MLCRARSRDNRSDYRTRTVSRVRTSDTRHCRLNEVQRRRFMRVPHDTWNRGLRGDGTVMDDCRPRTIEIRWRYCVSIIRCYSVIESLQHTRLSVLTRDVVKILRERLRYVYRQTIAPDENCWRVKSRIAANTCIFDTSARALSVWSSGLEYFLAGNFPPGHGILYRLEIIEKNQHLIYDARH